MKEYGNAMRIKLYPAILAIYQELYQQATINSGFVFQPKKQDRLLICSFIKWLNKTYIQQQITEDLLIVYFEFQFSRYAGIKTPKGKNSIMLNWLIGAKAIKAWQERDINKRYFVRWKCNQEFKLKLKQAFKKTVKVNNLPFTNGLNKYEELEKRRFYNKEEGYVYCGAMTTLYNPLSDLCEACKFKTECIERLRLNYLKLYQKRMSYESTTI